MLRRFAGQVVAVGAALAMGATMAVACGSTKPCTIGGGDYYAVLPEGLPKGGILFLHGWGGDARKEVAIAGTAGVVTARGYVFVAPVGLPYRPDEPVSNWNAELDPLNRDDVNFLRDVMDDAARRFEFPRSNVMVAGFSLGGMMVWRLCPSSKDLEQAA